MLKSTLWLIFLTFPLFSDIITFDEFAGDHPYGLYYGSYRENGMIIERKGEHIPLFTYNQPVLSFLETNGPFISCDGSEVIFTMEDNTFDLLSLDIVEGLGVPNFWLLGNGGALRFDAYGPLDNIIRPTLGTHSLAEYDFLKNLTSFSIIGSHVALDNFVYNVNEQVPESTTTAFMFTGLLLMFLKVQKRKKIILLKGKHEN